MDKLASSMGCDLLPHGYRCIWLAVLLSLAGCGGGGGGGGPAPATYTVGGTLTGLSGTLVLQNNNSDALTLTNNGAFTFSTALTSGSAFSVTVETQPSGQTCAITGATGSVTASVTSVAVTCTTNTPSFSGLWTWQSGSDLGGSAGTFGTLGSPAPGNVPRARDGATAWMDASGDFWLFGGGMNNQFSNDFWRYDSATGQWTWMGGTQDFLGYPVYGTQGTASAANVPGGRYGANAWTDASGKFWLFGGEGYNANDDTNFLNDLWSYDPANGQWTWVAGPNMPPNSPIYGTQGTPAAGNIPGGRQFACSGTDASHRFWLFGGYGYDSTGAAGLLNDLWRFDPSTGQWTWISGSNLVGAASVYGTQGTAAAGNIPGARETAGCMVDATGNVWLFGGDNGNANGMPFLLNDFWKFDASTGQWTWISGSQSTNAKGVYGTLGTAAAANVPGARINPVAWIDASGRLLMFGGLGEDSTDQFGELNDLWQYSPSAGAWIWVGGSNMEDPSGTYGTLGVAAAGNTPGGRSYPAAALDASGKLWLFGGFGFDSTGAPGLLNDLWTL